MGMKLHLIGKGSSSACGRHILFGAGRVRDIDISSPKNFYRVATNNKDDVCSHCLKIFNEKVRQAHVA